MAGSCVHCNDFHLHFNFPQRNVLREIRIFFLQNKRKTASIIKRWPELWVKFPKNAPKPRFGSRGQGERLGGLKIWSNMRPTRFLSHRSDSSLSANSQSSNLPGKSLGEDRASRDPSPSPSSLRLFSLHTTVDPPSRGMSSLGLRNGIVVAVSLNPAASTSFLDPGLNKLASEIAVRKYVAILSGIVRLSPLFCSPYPSYLSMNVVDTHNSSFSLVGRRA